MTIPFWLAVTTYLENHQWVVLSDTNFWGYLIGLAGGTFALLMTVNALGSQFQKIADNNFVVHKVPGLIFIGLGLYNFYEWL
jgi:hypothetical protein